MIWSIYYPQIVYFHPVFEGVDERNLVIEQKSAQGPQNKMKVVQNMSISSCILNLSRQDLKQAGYVTNKLAWSEQQDKKLKYLRDQQLLNWNQLAKLIPGRNSKMCYSRYRRLQNNTKQSWKKKDDELLLNLIQIYGQQWKEISKYFDSKNIYIIERTYKQIKQHYVNYLRPDINKNQWNLQEDFKLVLFLNQFGKNWKIIQPFFQGRTQNQIKNRYFGRLKRLAEKKGAFKLKNSKVQKQERKIDNL